MDALSLSLLTKGRTIRGLEEPHGAYKLLDKNALPNFSSSRRPFPTTTHREPQPALFERAPQDEGRRKKEEGRKDTEPAPLEESQTKAETAAADGLTATPVPVPAPEPVQANGQPTKPGLWSRLPGVFGAWKRIRIPWRKASPFQGATVQAELGLDQVKVIRNDLGEDDLEVVMIERKAGKQTAKPAQSEEVEREKLTANP